MKFAFPGLNGIIAIKENQINSLVIENPNLLFEVIDDIKMQLDKKDGKGVFSVNNEPIEVCKTVEMLTDIYGMDFNSKTMISKMVDELSRKAVREEYYEKTMRMIADLQNYVNDLVWDMECEIDCMEIAPKQIFKAINLCVMEKEGELVERILKYVEVIREFLGEKLFIFVNFRAFIAQKRFEVLAATLVEHGFQVLFIDNRDYPRVSEENRG